MPRRSKQVSAPTTKFCRRPKRRKCRRRTERFRARTFLRSSNGSARSCESGLLNEARRIDRRRAPQQLEVQRSAAEHHLLEGRIHGRLPQYAIGVELNLKL